MAYDVFVVAAKQDRELAKLVVRRLRALKMKVMYDAKNDDDTFTSKEARKLEQSDSVLVLWSKDGVKSDEVRAAASQGYSMKDQALVQVTLDGTKPYEPFSAMTLHSLKGLTSRTNPEGWYKTVDALGDVQGRKDLRAWLDLKATDKAGQAAWKKAHPKDPLSQVGAPAPKPSVAPKAAAAAGATLAGAAAAGLAAAQVSKPAAAATAARVSHDEDIGGFGWGTILGILAGIVAMLLLAWLWRTDYKPSGIPVANAGAVIAKTCPAGQMPRSMLNILEPGGIVDDTGN